MSREDRFDMELETPEFLVRTWWSLIGRRDFAGAARLCSSAAVVEWPLSNERMASIENWQLVNEHYPGTWNATIIELIADGDSVVTVAKVFDEQTSVTAISFFMIHNGLIQKIVEYWPETYDAPEWRSQWTEPLS